MEVQTVAIVSTGEMGAAIGKLLRDAGLDIITCLEGRSDLTRSRANEAGIRDVPSMDQLVSGSDLIMSVLVPAEATSLARRVAESISRTGARPAYADCNAISPQTTMNISKTAEVDDEGNWTTVISAAVFIL